MKKITLLIFFACCFLSCSKDDPNINPLEGRWYYQQIIYADYAGDKVVSSTGTLFDCNGDSYYDIFDNHVGLKEFLSCKNWNIFQGTFNSEKKEITIANSSSEYSVYDVHLENGKLILEATTTSIIDNELWTHTVTQICVRR